MQQRKFALLDRCMGWLSFTVAAVTYGLTIEPTASLWDCPEFIACGYKLEIGHPPGAPFFMLATNLFAQLASSPSEVARMVNLLSALLSAGCIMFLFWTITHLARKLVADGGEYTCRQVLLIKVCGWVGALAYAFSDTFWFSAVEAEDKICNENCKGWIHPFLVRAAFRLYDGKTHVKHTAPVLMVPNTEPMICEMYRGEATRENQEVHSVHTYAMQLAYRLNKAIDPVWSDVIKGIDIYVSKPDDRYLYDYDKNREDPFCLFIKEAVKNKTLGKLGDWQHKVNETEYQSAENGTHDYLTIGKRESGLGDESVFRMLKSIPIGEKAGGFKQIKLEPGQYKSLVTQEHLQDDYMSHASKVARMGRVYNGRLNLAGVTLRMPEGFNLRNAVQYLEDGGEELSVYYRIGGNGGGKLYYAGKTSEAKIEEIHYLFSPNDDTTEAIVVDRKGQWRLLPMKQHALLNGASWYDADLTTSMPTADWAKEEAEQGHVTDARSNTIMTSAVNNPFVWPAEGENTVGSGEILAITAMAQPLSQGQMGEYPLIAMCTDGNYALSVIKSGELAGLYDSVTPMVPEICHSAESVTQMEEGIMYVGKSGLLLLQGNSVTRLDDALDGPMQENVTEEDGPSNVRPMKTMRSEPEIGTPTLTSIEDKQLNPGQETESETETKIYPPETVLPYAVFSTFYTDYEGTGVSMKLLKGAKYDVVVDATRVKVKRDGRGTNNARPFNLTMKFGENEATLKNIPAVVGESLGEFSFGFTACKTEEDAKLLFNVSHSLTLDTSESATVDIIIYETKKKSEDPGEGEPGEGEPGEGEPGEGGGNTGEDSEDGDGTVVIRPWPEVKKDFWNIGTRDFVRECRIVIDATNNRILLVEEGCDTAYQMKMDTKVWSTVELPGFVQVVIQSYPYTYVQMDGGIVMVIDRDHNYEDKDVIVGRIVTRPLKMDTLQMKRICEMALQGCYGEVQKITLMGSQDGNEWVKIGSTTNRRTPHIIGRWYKYWKIRIDTRLKCGEDISGVSLRYDVRRETRIR